MPLGTSFRALLGAGVAGPWDVIDSVELGSAAPSVSFQSIDSKYKMFRVTAYLINDANVASFLLRLNNDSGSNYNRQLLQGLDTTVSAVRTASATSIEVTGGIAVAASGIVTLEAIIAKQVAGSAGMVLVGVTQPTDAGALYTARVAGQWANTSDLINRIDLISSAGDFAAGTVVVLEGA